MKTLVTGESYKLAQEQSLSMDIQQTPQSVIMNVKSHLGAPTHKMCILFNFSSDVTMKLTVESVKRYCWNKGNKCVFFPACITSVVLM